MDTSVTTSSFRHSDLSSSGPVCPEVEAGMGTPREAIDLVASDDGVTAGGMRVSARRP